MDNDWVQFIKDRFYDQFVDLAYPGAKCQQNKGAINFTVVVLGEFGGRGNHGGILESGGITLGMCDDKSTVLWPKSEGKRTRLLNYSHQGPDLIRNFCPIR